MSKVTITNPNIDISSDEEEDSLEHFVPYKERPEWADVKPIPQDDGPYSVVSIRYTETFQETFDYFRAILASKEISERAFDLTHSCIGLNPSNYTVWHYRRVLLENLNKNLLDELEYIESTISRNQKNYQVWEHYKYVLSQIKRKLDQKQLSNVNLIEVATKVKRFIRSILSDDSKNYHAWQQLQWLIRDWSQWDGELEYVEKLVDDDIRNNSAWNHRFYVIQRTTGFSEEVIQAETEFAIKMINLAPNNESAWNYLLGVIHKSGKSISSFPNVLESCEKLYQDPEKRSSYLLGFLVTHLGETLEESKSGASTEGGDNQDTFRQIFNQAIDYCNQLASKVDTLRQQYWKYQANLLTDKFQPLL